MPVPFAPKPSVSPMFAMTSQSMQSNKRSLMFCTTREAADILGISLRTAQLWRRAV